MEYKIGYYRFGRFKAFIVTNSLSVAEMERDELEKKDSKHKWIIKPLCKREYARGVWRDCPF